MAKQFKSKNIKLYAINILKQKKARNLIRAFYLFIVINDDVLLVREHDRGLTLLM